MSKRIIYDQINQITSMLIGVGLSEQQNFPSEKDGSIYIANHPDLSITLKNIPYSDIYHVLDSTKNYNIKMIDGALIQLMYNFDSSDTLVKYRLAFFPSPSLEEFQNSPDIYELDEIYADVILKNVVTTPIRFDYDPVNFIQIDHPKSHVTIGQYKNCRIPVAGAMTPNIFIDFILRNFYNTARSKYSVELNLDPSCIYEHCIDDLERNIVHLSFASPQRSK